ncbi:MAG: AsmA family protein, partial [Pusillimonas sp.]
AKTDEQPAPAAEPKQPAKRPAPSAEPFIMPNLSFLDSADLTGTVAIDDLKVGDLQVGRLAAAIRAAQGKLSINNIKADLYGGSLNGAVTASSANEVTADISLAKVALGPLLQALARENRLEGQGAVKLKLATQGATGAALEAGLTGTTRVRIRDGAVTGIDVAQTLREVNDVVRNMFSGQLPEVASRFDTGRKTDFASLDTDIDFDHGQGTIKALNVVAPLLRITQGKPATLDLVNDQLDVMINVKVVNTSTGQGGKVLSDLKGVSVPLRISGPFSKPGYQVQWKEISSETVKDAVKGGLIDLISNQISKPATGANAAGTAPRSATDSVKSIGEALKGLLGQ